MIVVEHRLRDLIGLMPAVNLNADFQNVKVKFGWGNKLELNRYLKLKKGGSYPLIWLLPSSETHLNDGERVQKKCSFIIATLEKDVNLFNDERYLKSYDLVLNPITENLIFGLNNSTISEIIDNEYELFKMPNYSDEAAGEQNATIELWDAIKLDCKIEINNDCLNTNILWPNE